MKFVQNILKPVVILRRKLIVAVFVCREHARDEHTEKHYRGGKDEHTFVGASVAEALNEAEKQKEQYTRDGQLAGPGVRQQVGDPGRYEEERDIPCERKQHGQALFDHERRKVNRKDVDEEHQAGDVGLCFFERRSAVDHRS